MDAIYHGTTAYAALRAVDEGLLPRSKSGHISQWNGTLWNSNPNLVYLTTLNAPFYAFQVSPFKCGIVEIDFGMLNEKNFLPDEDFLFDYFTRLPHLGSPQFRVVYNMARRLPEEKAVVKIGRHFARNIELYQDLSDASLEEYGEIGHLGVIPPEAIRRIAIFSKRDARVREVKARYDERFNSFCGSIKLSKATVGDFEFTPDLFAAALVLRRGDPRAFQLLKEERAAREKYNVQDGVDVWARETV
jgi:hypothetical protein